eukprot:1927001-Amphidinium_carterae.1
MISSLERGFSSAPVGQKRGRPAVPRGSRSPDGPGRALLRHHSKSHSAYPAPAAHAPPIASLH